MLDDGSRVLARQKALPVSSYSSKSSTSVFDSMDFIFKDRALLTAFEESLQKEFAAESLLFYRASQHYRDKVTAVKSKNDFTGSIESEETLQCAKTIIGEAQVIFNKFINPVTATAQVNIRGNMRKDIESILADAQSALSSSQPRLNLANLSKIFDVAIREVTTMLIKDKIPNFVHGENAPRRLRFTAVAIEEMADLLSLWAKEEDFLLRHDAFDLSMEQRSEWDQHFKSSQFTSAMQNVLVRQNPSHLREANEGPLLPPSALFLSQCGRFPSTDGLIKSSQSDISSILGTTPPPTAIKPMSQWHSHQIRCQQEAWSTFRDLAEFPAKLRIKIGIIYVGSGSKRNIFQNDIFMHDIADFIGTDGDGESPDGAGNFDPQKRHEETCTVGACPTTFKRLNRSV